MLVPHMSNNSSLPLWPSEGQAEEQTWHLRRQDQISGALSPPSCSCPSFMTRLAKGNDECNAISLQNSSWVSFMRETMCFVNRREAKCLTVSFYCPCACCKLSGPKEMPSGVLSPWREVVAVLCGRSS